MNNTADAKNAEEIKQGNGTSGKLTRGDVRKSWINWLFHNQACYNYERMQGIGFLHAMVPIINRLYKDDPEGKKAAMQRHTGFFNSEPCFGSPIVGLTVAMEEKRAEGADLDDEAINSVKSGLMGPSSGIGDTVIQGVLVPLLLAFAISISVSGNLVGPVLYSVVITAVILGISYLGFMLGYKKGNEAIINMLESGIINKVVVGASIMGCMVLGALVANYVSLSCSIEIAQSAGKTFSIQKELFDVICPKILPLLLTFGCAKLMDKGHSSIRIMLYIIVFGVVGGLLGII
nr:PTS system mannose/fructose/sorbose family transporter subunit IID [uncultured Caproiciproducens sp.]